VATFKNFLDVTGPNPKMLPVNAITDEVPGRRNHTDAKTPSQTQT
jgi:hypothetical protein